MYEKRRENYVELHVQNQSPNTSCFSRNTNEWRYYRFEH